LRKAKAEEPVAEPEAGSGAAAIVDAYKKARGGK